MSRPNLEFGSSFRLDLSKQQLTIGLPHLSDLQLPTNLNNMSKKAALNDAESKERIVPQLYTASEGQLSVPQAMKIEDFPTPDRRNPTLIKRVWRKSNNLTVVDQKSLASTAASISVSHKPTVETIEAQNIPTFLNCRKVPLLLNSLY